MKFLVGVVVGIVGYWAYEQGWLPFGARDAFERTAMPGSQATIVRPTPREVAERPSQPMPA